MSHLAYANSKIASSYIKTRPSPPASIAKYVLQYLKEKQGEGSARLKLCVDVGCGSGQNTGHYADYFQQVIGFDTSPDQLALARTNNTYTNVVYKQAKAECLPIEDASVDLVTCCQSVHWFDLDTFFSEVNRVLRPGGVLACYAGLSGELYYNGKNLTAHITELFTSWKEFIFEGYRHCMQEYKTLPDLYPDQVLISRADGKFYVEYGRTVDEYMEIIPSIPIYHDAVAKFGQKSVDSSIAAVKQKLREEMGTKNPQEKLTVRFPYFLRMYRKPLN